MIHCPARATTSSATIPQKWRTNVPTYAKVKYANVYSGVDLVYSGNQRQLEFDLVVQPGADPQGGQARLWKKNKVALRINDKGDLAGR